VGPHSAARRPDLILLDLNLPRMGGREVLAEIKGDLDLMRIPIVILTTSCAESDITGSYALHANCYVVKPPDLHQFFAMIRIIEKFWLSAVTLSPS
jgi:CheY-like chemotaxis protein